MHIFADISEADVKLLTFSKKLNTINRRKP